MNSVTIGNSAVTNCVSTHQQQISALQADALLYRDGIHFARRHISPRVIKRRPMCMIPEAASKSFAFGATTPFDDPDFLSPETGRAIFGTPTFFSTCSRFTTL